MCFVHLLFLFIIFPINCFGSGDFTVTDEEYYEMPDLFYLDNYAKCLSKSENLFCAGVFEISSVKPSRVYEIVQKISQNSFRNFNHTKIHRGICLGNQGSCPLDPNLSWKNNFENCVQIITKKTHDFDTNLVEFNGCKYKEYKRPWDFYDRMFLTYVFLVIGLNVIGTYHDIFMKGDDKGNPWLICFSLKANWKRFTYIGVPDERYRSLNCFNALRGMLVPFVLLAHVPLALMTYTVNPNDVEALSDSPDLKIVTSGTVAVQIFIIISSFLQTFQMLIYSEYKIISFKDIIVLIIDRYVRLSPMFLTAVGFSSTLAPHYIDGALWSLVEKEADQCRATFWRQFFFMQHWYAPGCLAQAWFLAVSFQIFIICAVLIFYLLKTKTDIIRTVTNIFIVNQLVVYTVVYFNELKPNAQSMNPEVFISLFSKDKSFMLLYQSLWGNLSSALLGVLAAYIYYQMRTNKIDLRNNKFLHITISLSVPLILLIVIGGYFAVTAMSSRLLVSLYATLDKLFFSVAVLFFIFGCLFEVDHAYIKITEWSGWTYISRLSLGSLLFHTVHTKSQTANLLSLQTFSRASTISNWFANMTATFLLVLPLTLMIELPFIALWKTVISSTKRSCTEKVKEVNGYVSVDNNLTMKS